MERYANRINLGMLESKAAQATRHTGRDDRATVEQVMDPRTRLILFKLLNSGVITEVNGCVSTGKEANVYHALGPQGKAYALKIYKTSILVFKDRDRYVSGEFRFRSGYSKGNPRKMVRVWAEKEMRNLRRLHAAGFPVPYPHILRSHVLVMDFLGEDGWPAQRLKDAAPGLSASKLADAYMEVVDSMRGMYQACRLVHADLSEYNMLYHNGHVVVIDVSQSVETDHPRALDFLRVDCQNVTDFFRRAGVLTMAPRELFDYVVHASLASKEDEQAYMDEMRSRAEARVDNATAAAHSSPTDGDVSGDAGDGKAAAAAAVAEAEVENAVFMQSYIPQSLFGVRDVEAETRKVIKGDTGDLYYKALAGLEPAPSRASEQGGAETSAVEPQQQLAAVAESDSGDDEEGSSDNDDAADGDADGQLGGKSRKDMTKEEWKAYKATVKESQREKRKTKIPKHVKKRHAKTNKK